MGRKRKQKSPLDLFKEYIAKQYADYVFFTQESMIFIAHPNKGFHGAFIQIYEHSDNYTCTKGRPRSRIRFNKDQRILDKLDSKNYYAGVGVGFIATKKMIDWYLKG